MLGFRDTLTLATTKLRIRRIRLITTLVVSGALFTVLIFGSLFVRGATNSLESFTQEGFLNRFISQIINFGSYQLFEDKTYTERATQLEKARVAEQVKAAKRLGVPFDPATAPKAVVEFGDPNNKQKTLSLEHPSAQQAVRELTVEDIRQRSTQAAAKYGVKTIYDGFRFAANFNPGEYTLTPIIKGKEQEQNSLGRGDYTDSIASFQTRLNALDDRLLQPFLLEGATLTTGPSDPLPVLAPVDAVEKILGFKPLGTKATPEQKIARLAELRGKAKNLTFELCYRNKAALDIRGSAKQQAEEIALRKKEVGFEMPSVVYGATDTACAPVPIAKDTRTAAEKAQALKETQFKEEFGATKPSITRIPLRVVGLMPQLGGASPIEGIEGFLASFFTPTLGSGWFISYQAASQQPIFSALMKDKLSIAAGAQEVYIEFNNREGQKRFAEEKGCGNRPECPSDKFRAMPYGNPLAAIFDLGPGFTVFFQIVLGIIAALSGIVMMGTIGKIIADSRKETSVFRAVGAKRLDIAQVYLLYAVILATLAFLVASALGLAAALYIESTYHASISAHAVLAFNSSDLHKTFHLIGFNLMDFATIYGFILLLGLLSASIPLLGNVRRNPVKDMREE